MEAAANHVRTVNQEIQQQLSSLMGRIEPLASAWKGEAQISFMQLHARWDENAKRLNRALSDIAEAIQQSKVQYQQSDEQQASSFGGIGQALG